MEPSKLVPGKKVWLSVADGPESIEIYTDGEKGVVDWSPQDPALYLTATLNGASVKLGPFTLRTIYEGLVSQLK